MALKKLREGESKRYNMGLERIAQVHILSVRACVNVHINVKWVSVDIYIKMCPISIVHVCLGAIRHQFQMLHYKM